MMCSQLESNLSLLLSSQAIRPTRKQLLGREAAGQDLLTFESLRDLIRDCSRSRQILEEFSPVGC
jgi:hypothetical protein